MDNEMDEEEYKTMAVTIKGVGVSGDMYAAVLLSAGSFKCRQ